MKELHLSQSELGWLAWRFGSVDTIAQNAAAMRR